MWMLRMVSTPALLLLLCGCVISKTAEPLNVVIILADDLGWNDVGFNNPDIISPNIDDLANNGVILNNSYVQPVCTPSRSALMTGVYPFRLGLQHMVIMPQQDVCAPLNRTFLPQVFKQNGYATHMIGKWHLGMCKWECTPTYRGFDSFFGYYQGMEDYYTKEIVGGFDFRFNKTVLTSANGTYSSYMYGDRIKDIVQDHNASQPLFMYLAFQDCHNPLQVPKKYYDMYPHIKDEQRRTFSGMVTALDDAIGETVTALKNKNMFDNTLFFFSGDNGGMVTLGGNNYPLRGSKATIFEGGTRAAAFLKGPMFTKNVRYNGMIHVIDWFPTLLEAAHLKNPATDQDGMSHWQDILNLQATKRQEFVYNLDFSTFPIQGEAAIRVGDYKLIEGFPGLFPGWYKPAQVSAQVPQEMVELGFILGGAQQVNMTLVKRVMQREKGPVLFKALFNLKDDPYERNDLYFKEPEMVKKLHERLEFYKQSYIPPNYPPNNPKGNPANWGGNWSPGWC